MEKLSTIDYPTRLFYVFLQDVHTPLRWFQIGLMYCFITGSPRSLLQYSTCINAQKHGSYPAMANCSIVH